MEDLVNFTEHLHAVVGGEGVWRKVTFDNQCAFLGLLSERMNRNDKYLFVYISLTVKMYHLDDVST